MINLNLSLDLIDNNILCYIKTFIIFLIKIKEVLIMTINILINLATLIIMAKML